MSTIKVYLVFKEVPELDTYRIYHICRSRHIAKRKFLSKAFRFMRVAQPSGSRLRCIKVALPQYYYKALKSSCNIENDPWLNFILNDIFYNLKYTDISMVNDLTYSLDFLPYCLPDYVQMPKSERPSLNIDRWLYKYLRETF